jgi:superfamily II DNA or RNA helicase
MGAENKRTVFSNSKIKKRIGLSATPKRIYDVQGTLFLDSFFHDEPPYLYEFSMKQALDEGYLTNYKYFPILVELNDDELEQYIEISKKLLRYFDFEKMTFKNDPYVETLLQQRKNLIHKAANKVSCFRHILLELQRLNKLKYIFSYIPEGFVTDIDGSREKMLNKFLRAGHETIASLKMNSYTSEDQNLNDLLRGFSEGVIDLLFAMKMLDEGVDVPRAEVGIFASNTGNPRQFVQRRGRLLRRHDEKALALIYDLVVIPKIDKEESPFFNMERNLVHNELRRVAYFASLAVNFYDSQGELDGICSKYNLDLDTIINEL